MTIDHSMILIFTMIISGIFGGVTATALEKKIEISGELVRNCVIGTAASILVPLFLNFISSDIVSSTKNDQSKFLVFVGFCVTAAIFSKRFIISISTQLLRDELNQVERSIEEIKREQRIDKFYKDSLFHIQNNNHALALSELDHWIELDGESSRPYLGKARAYRAMGNYEEAIKMTTKAISFNDNYKYKGYYNRACYKLKSNIHDIQSALEDLKIAVHLHPDYKSYAKLDNDLRELHEEPQFKEITS